MKNSTLLAGACLVACGALWTIPVTGADVITHDRTVTKTDAKASLNLPPGVQAKDLNAQSGVERALTSVASDALTKNGFDNLIGWLSTQDKSRLSDKKNMKVDDLNALADKINGSYKAKYNHNFSPEKKALDNFITIVTGEVTDPDQLVGKWPVDAGVKGHVMNAIDKGADAARGKPDMGGKVTPSDAQIAKDKMFGGSVKLEKGRNVALVHFPASHGLPAVTASLIDETTSWRFDIPNNITADQLHASLLKCLTNLSNRTDWPSDAYEAQREICHSVIAALYGVESSSSMKTAGEK